MRVICFGAAGGGRRLFDIISNNHTILAFTDNDSKKWGEKLNGIQILSISEALKLNYDKIILTSAPGKDSIINQLVAMGIENKQIDTSYIDGPLEARIIYLEKLAELHKNIPDEVNVAEAGVFEGDFAKWINYYYPERKLYLFDTFEGFSEKDLQHEQEMSDAKLGDYANTSIDVVLSKMKYNHNIIIKKGYFPETAKDINGKFCFVNLDLDLYEPTYNGLLFFSKKMVDNGVILVHDYYATNFKGPKEAVDKFIKESNKKYKLFPIGDGISIMICGF